MAVRMDETIVMAEDHGAHLDPAQIATFVDRAVEGDDRARIESHLASCAECRAEVADTADIVREARRRRHRPAWVAAVAAAAVVAMVVWPRGIGESPPIHRDAPVTTTIAPAAVHPVGIVDSAPALLWTAVPYADRYRLRVFTPDGSVLWESESTDTLLVIPASAGVRPGRTYYWKVEAQVGFDRAVASELTAFTIRSPR